VFVCVFVFVCVCVCVCVFVCVCVCACVRAPELPIEVKYLTSVFVELK